MKETNVNEENKPVSSTSSGAATCSVFQCGCCSHIYEIPASEFAGVCPQCGSAKLMEHGKQCQCEDYPCCGC